MVMEIGEYVKFREMALITLQLFMMFNTLIVGLMLIYSMKYTYNLERSKINPVFNTPGASLFSVTLHKYQWFLIIQIISVFFVAIMAYKDLVGMNLVLENTERVVINGIEIDKCTYRDKLLDIVVIGNKLVK